MRNEMLGILCAFLLAGCAAAPTGPSDPVVLQRDVVYGRGGDRDLLMDIACPAEKPGEPMPVIVFIHGGAWRMGDKGDETKSMMGYAENGYFCASPGYRLSQEAVFPAQIFDVKCAIRFLRAHAKKYGINPQLIGVHGGSAGGHLAALLGTSCGAKDLEGEGGWADESSCVQAVCDYFGPSDFEAIAANAAWMEKNDGNPEDAIYQLFGGPLSENMNKARMASPTHFVSPEDPPFLIVHGTNDWIVPYAMSPHLRDALKEAGVEAELVTIEGAGHGDWKFWAAKPWEKQAEFFERHLKPGGKR